MTKEEVIKELESLGFKSTPNSFAREPLSPQTSPMYFNVVSDTYIVFCPNGDYWKLKYDIKSKDFSYWRINQFSRYEWSKINEDLDIASMIVLYGN